MLAVCCMLQILLLLISIEMVEWHEPSLSLFWLGVEGVEMSESSKSLSLWVVSDPLSSHSLTCFFSSHSDWDGRKPNSCFFCIESFFCLDFSGAYCPWYKFSKLISLNTGWDFNLVKLNAPSLSDGLLIKIWEIRSAISAVARSGISNDPFLIAEKTSV